MKVSEVGSLGALTQVSEQSNGGGSCNRPRVTFAVVAFRQEEFIREAIEGAFAQDYSPLEILLSDDCSPDKTYALMEELVASYRGPHKVLLNRNQNNLGIAGHINRVMEIAGGDLIVIAAGDDVSLPHRVSETVSEALNEPAAYSLFGDLEFFGDEVSGNERFRPDLSSHDLPQMIRVGGAKVAGPSHAWRREVFDVFGPLPSDAYSEDRVIPFRSALLGRVKWVPKVWARYRLHDSSISSTNRYTVDLSVYNKARLAPFLRTAATFRSFQLDLKTALRVGLISASDYEQYSRFVSAEAAQLSKYIRAWDSSYLDRVACAFSILVNPSPYTGDSGMHRAAIFASACFPFLDRLYHKLVRVPRFPK